MRLLSVSVTLLIFGLPPVSWAAHSHDHTHQELEDIKQRLKVIERDTERRRITGAEERKEFKDKSLEAEEAYPVLSSQKTRLSGGLTFILQGATNNEQQFGGNRADGSLSIGAETSMATAPALSFMPILLTCSNSTRGFLRVTAIIPT